MAIDTIKFKRGVKSKLNNLSYGEPAYISDENELYIGTEDGVEKITRNKEVAELSSQLEQIENNNNDFILYAFFRNLSYFGVDLYISQDGDTLQRINANAVIEGKDPSIFYKNGFWYIAVTSFNPHDFTIYKSSDLVSWDRHDISVGIYNIENNKVWAPEWFEDDNGKLYLTLSVKVGDDVDIDDEQISYFRSCIVECIDIDNLKFGSPRMINLDGGNKIDPVIIKEKNVYHMFVKDEHAKYIEHWTSSDLVNWVYKKDIIELGKYVEGATIIKRNNKFYLYADAFKLDTGLVYYVTSNNLEEWSARRTIKVGVNPTRHGTALVVKDNKAKLDVQKFTSANIAIPSHNIRTRGFLLNQFADSNGMIENLEIIDNCVYSIRDGEHFTINSFTNPNNAKSFYLYIATNSKGSITINCNSKIVSVPNGYSYTAESGDNDVLIKFMYLESAGVFKPTTASNSFFINKTQLKKGGWKTVTLKSQTINKMSVEDGVVYRVFDNNNVIINDVDYLVNNGTHFYLLLTSSGTGSITVNTGPGIVVPGGRFEINATNGRENVLFEFIKVDGSVFRLRQ